MSSIVESDSDIIISFLVEKFDLKSTEQVTKLTCDTFGFCSDQFRFKLLTNDGDVLNLFIKKLVIKTERDQRDPKKEMTMYEMFIPEIVSFIKSVDEELAAKVRSCFVKFYMSHHTVDKFNRPLHYLVLEDFTCREGNFNFRDVPELVAERLGVIHGSFLAWQRSKHPGLTPAEMLEKYPFLTEYFTAETGDRSESFFIRQTLAADKIIRTDDDFLLSPDRDNLASKLAHLVNLCPHLARLRHESQKPRLQLFCPTLGDLHGGNIAISESFKDIIFFDFDIVRISSPLIDFHNFTSWGLKYLPSQKPVLRCFSPTLIQNLLEIYFTSFISTCKSLNCQITRSLLQDEYESTHTWYTISSFYMTLFTMETQGVSNEEEDKFMKKIISLAVDNESDRIREVVGSFGQPVKVFKENVMKFLRSVETEQLDSLDKLAIELDLQV